MNKKRISLKNTAVVACVLSEVDSLPDAAALVSSHHINASGAIHARVASTLVDVAATLRSGAASRTCALVAVDAVHTHFVLFALRINTIIDVDATVGAREAARTRAREVTRR